MIKSLECVLGVLGGFAPVPGAERAHGEPSEGSTVWSERLSHNNNSCSWPGPGRDGVSQLNDNWRWHWALSSEASSKGTDVLCAWPAATQSRQTSLAMELGGGMVWCRHRCSQMPAVLSASDKPCTHPPNTHTQHTHTDWRFASYAWRHWVFEISACSVAQVCLTLFDPMDCRCITGCDGPPPAHCSLYMRQECSTVGPRQMAPLEIVRSVDIKIRKIKGKNCSNQLPPFKILASSHKMLGLQFPLKTQVPSSLQETISLHCKATAPKTCFFPLPAY